jgi:WD40 repeat protein/transcriptional regulator with XRE-family HTH domain
MSSTRLDEIRDYGFADKALALRERAGLTQRALAALLGVSGRAIQAWEAGLSYPGAGHLKHLIALYLERGTFPLGREEDEAAALWEAVRAHAPRRTVPFDRLWFASLSGAAGSAVSLPPVPQVDVPRRDDWGEAPDAGTFYGRTQEVETLSHWLLADRCRLIAVLGLGGVGKTLLASRFAREMAPQFDVVYWRSLRNAPPVEDWLAGAIAALSAQQVLPPDGSAARLRLLLEMLQERRGLLVLDNLETILEPGASEARYREGYAGYGEVLRRLGESSHQGCLLLTGREAPPELAPLVTGRGPVRTLRLGGLDRAAGRALLRERGLAGDEAAWDALIARYNGNPLALRVVGETIGAVFGGDIAAFLTQETAVFGGIRQLLDGQVGRLSTLERKIGSWLAVEREPAGFAELAADLGPGVARDEALEAVDALLRRSLLERGPGGTFTLQPVVLEYVTSRLVAQACDEVVTGEAALLVRQPLLKARAKDYVRRSQERLIAQPLLERLRGRLGSEEAVEERLRALLEDWRGRPLADHGYGPGNVLNLLRLLRGDLRGLDLSRLTIRQAYLQGVEAQGASLAGAQLHEAVLDEAFNYPTAIALSADGAYLVIGTSTGEICLWRAVDRTLLLALQGHSGAVLGVGLSGDGRLVISGSFDGTAKLWEAPSGRLLATLQGHTSGVRHVALSGDGRLVASGSQDGSVKLWESPGGQPRATLQGHTGGVRDVALSEDGRLLASGSYDGTIRLWEAESCRLLATLHGEDGGIWGLALSADGQSVASGGQDGMVRLWESSGGQLLEALQGHGDAVPAVALSGDGHLLASGSFDGTVKLWEVPPTEAGPGVDSLNGRGGSMGRLLATLQGHTHGVWGVALSGDGRLVASASYDGTIRLWEAPGGRLLATLEGQTSGVWGVALDADGRLVASSGWDGAVRLWDVPGGQLLATLLGHTGAVPGVALSRDGQLVASGSFDGTARLWAATPAWTSPRDYVPAGPGGSPGPLLETLQGHAGAVHAVAFSGDRRLLASGGLDGTVRLWEIPAGRLLATLEGHTGGVYSVALSEDGHLLASGSLDGTVRLWEVSSTGNGRGESTGRLLATLAGHSSGVHCVALSGNGQVVASGSLDRLVKLWEAPGGRLLATLEGHGSGVYGVALSRDGQVVASGSFDGTVRLWDATGGRLLRTLYGHATAVRSVALSGDGQLVVSGSYDGTVKLWDTPSGRLLATLRGDRPYERMDITGLTGVTEAQRAALLALGAVEQTTATPAPPSGAAHP